MENKVSVIITCFNQEKYIDEAIWSVKNQTFKDWQCVIVNDGSTDGSEEKILSSISGDSRFVYEFQENSGQGAARNKGVSLSSGKYVVNLDGDDMIASEYLERGVNAMDSDDSICVWWTRVMYFGIRNGEFNTAYKGYASLLKCNSICSGIMFRRSDFDACGGYDETMKGFDDWEFLIRLLYPGKKVVKESYFGYFYRKHGDSVNTSSNKNQKKLKEYIYDKNKKIYIENGLALKK